MTQGVQSLGLDPRDMKLNGFPKSARLLKSEDFDRVFHRRIAASDDRVVLHASVGTTDEARLGLVVSRKCGNAVTRNRWKRSLREAFRLIRSELPTFDFVVIPRCQELPTTTELVESFRTLSARLASRLRPASKEAL